MAGSPPHSRYKCQLCGTKEHSCQYVVHAIGGDAEVYNADKWLTSNIKQLQTCWGVLSTRRDAILLGELKGNNGFGGESGNPFGTEGTGGGGSGGGGEGGGCT